MKKIIIINGPNLNLLSESLNPLPNCWIAIVDEFVGLSNNKQSIFSMSIPSLNMSTTQAILILPSIKS